MDEAKVSNGTYTLSLLELQIFMQQAKKEAGFKSAKKKEGIFEENTRCSREILDSLDESVQSDMPEYTPGTSLAGSSPSSGGMPAGYL